MASLSRLLYRSLFTFSSTTTSTTPPIKQVLNDLFKEKNLTKLVEKFKQSSENDRFRSKHHIYRVTVGRLASAKRFNKIEEILEEQKKYHDITREGFAIRLISLYGRAGMVDHAAKTFDQLPELKCERSIKSFNALLNAYVDSKKFDEVEKLFREFPRKLSFTPDEYSYNITIQALCNLGNLDSAHSMLDEMEKKGLGPSLISFNILLRGFYESGRFLDGEKLWDRMEKKEVVPDIRSYNSKLRGLVLEGKISEAARLLEHLKTNGPKPDTFSYNALIKGYCKDGKLDDAKKEYDDLLENKCVENTWTYEPLIPALCESGDVDFALKLCRKGIKSNCHIGVEFVQNVIDALKKHSKLDDAKTLLKLAQSKSYGHKSLKVLSDDE